VGRAAHGWGRRLGLFLGDEGGHRLVDGDDCRRLNELALGGQLADGAGMGRIARDAVTAAVVALADFRGMAAVNQQVQARARECQYRIERQHQGGQADQESSRR